MAAWGMYFAGRAHAEALARRSRNNSNASNPGSRRTSVTDRGGKSVEENTPVVTEKAEVKRKVERSNSVDKGVAVQAQVKAQQAMPVVIITRPPDSRRKPSFSLGGAPNVPIEGVPDAVVGSPPREAVPTPAPTTPSKLRRGSADNSDKRIGTPDKIRVARKATEKRMKLMQDSIRAERAALSEQIREYERSRLPEKLLSRAREEKLTAELEAAKATGNNLVLDKDIAAAQLQRTQDEKTAAELIAKLQEAQRLAQEAAKRDDALLDAPVDLSLGEDNSARTEGVIAGKENDGTFLTQASVVLGAGSLGNVLGNIVNNASLPVSGVSADSRAKA